MPVARVAEQFDAPLGAEALPIAVPDATTEPQTIIDPQATAIIVLQAANAQLRAELAEARAPPPAQWAPLKAAAFDCGMNKETLRSWAVDGLVEARREGSRWFINVVSVKARQQRIAAPR